MPVVEKEAEREEVQSVTQQFYKECLATQSMICNQQRCFEVRSTLKSKIKHIQSKNQDIKDAIGTCRSIIAEKDQEIAALTKIVESLTVIGDCPSTSTESNIVDCPSTSTESNIVERQTEPLNFIEYVNYFSEDQLSQLRSIGGSKPEDSSFVSTALRGLYDGKLDTLRSKTVCGRGQKEKMTPKKVEIINEMFQQRLHKCTSDANERIVRKKRLNKLIKDAQFNITKSLNKKKEEDEICRRLQETSTQNE